MAIFKGRQLTLNMRATANITVDNALSATSENPVQNKVVTKALRGASMRLKITTSSANTAITFNSLTGMTAIDWGDGVCNANLSHTYETAGTYYCYIYGVTSIDTTTASFVSNTSIVKNVIFADNGVTVIGKKAFYNCSGIAFVKLGMGLQKIDDYVFFGCSGMNGIDIPNSVTQIGQQSFYACFGLNKITFPNYLISIKSAAFYSCSYLREVVIPITVTSLGSQAFAQCNGLQRVIFENTTPPTISSDTFDNTNNCPIYVPRSALATYKAATNYTTYATRIVANATTADLDTKQDTLTAGTGISISGNVISATGGGGGAAWNVASDFTNGTVTLSLTADKIYEIVALGYHPLGDFTPMSTGVFMLDTNSNYMESGSNVKNIFGTNTLDAECVVTMNSNTSVTLSWENNGSWSGWFIKVLYREATIAT